MMEDMKSQDFLQKFTVMMQELEQRTGGESTKAREDPVEDLKNLKQEFTLQDYWNSFNQLYSKARIQEEKALNFFLSGLVDELQLVVKMFKPRTLSEAYSLARLQEVTVATIKNNVNPDTKPTIFVTASFPPSTPSNLQSNFPKLSGSGDKFDLLPIPIIQLPKLPVYLQEIQNWSIMKISKVRRVSMEVLFLNLLRFMKVQHMFLLLKKLTSTKRVGGKKQYMNYGNYGDFDLGAHEKYRNYENCVDFDLSDHDYITLKEDEFERWKRQRKKFYGCEFAV
ncbi:hypothetical protein GH714_033801 [Hevea brasiliensis]|uniref:Retrotransposon gag domain-containing protein n=1 Tax=Hevea brasiliensis TaxID=3981 RepID=A0A6A6NDV8_HEVBR|nr:hypothetical protein GH714_033801 [Hevea brasiliensis]